MKNIMSEEKYHYWKGKLSQYDDLPDGAWWASCESEIGGYDNFMAYLHASKKYEKEI